MSTPMALPAASPQQGRTWPARRAGGLGILCVVAAVIVTRLPFRRMTSVLATVKLACSHTATRTEAEHAVQVAHAGARWYLGRAACLERSIAAFLLAAGRGRSLDLCIGARLNPYASHAWVEVDGHPVGEPFGPDRPYLTLLRI
jgi:hypothetical protein